MTGKDPLDIGAFGARASGRRLAAQSVIVAHHCLARGAGLEHLDQDAIGRAEHQIAA